MREVGNSSRFLRRTVRIRVCLEAYRIGCEAWDRLQPLRASAVKAVRFGSPNGIGIAKGEDLIRSFFQIAPLPWLAETPGNFELCYHL